MPKFPSKVIYGSEARNHLLRGINIVAEAVGSTLGPQGRNVAMNEVHLAPIVVCDGVTVAKRIDLMDEFEDMGAALLKQAAIKTNDVAGDGTTTSVILAQAIIQKGLENITAGANPMTIKRQIEIALKSVLKELKSLSRKIKTAEEIEQVATISSADPRLGSLVAKAIKRVGKDGVITVEEGKGFKTEVEYKKGMEINRGYLSPYFVTDQKRVEAIIEDPYILLTDKRINYNREIVPFIEKFLKKSRNLVVIAGEVVDEALATFVVNRLKGNINVCAIQAPAFGGRRVDELEDIAILTGGVAILNDSGREIASVQIEELGRADKFIADRDKSIILNGHGSKEAVKARIDDLKGQMKVANTDFDRDIKEERMATLGGGIAVINVGAATEVELRDKKERIVDAINSTKAAIEEGIIAGGAIALLEISRLDNWEDDVGSKILRDALKRPFRKLVENAGFDYAEMWGKLEKTEYPEGIDVTKGMVCDLISAGIIDPVKVTRSALENAVSVATMIMTTDTLISEPYDKKEEK